MTDLARFLASAEQMRIDLAELTLTSPADVNQAAAESLVVLHELGELVLPALREATGGAPVALATAITGPITALVNTASQASLPSTILWGNVASVIASSVTILASQTPQHSDQLHAVAEEALGSPPLAGAWTGRLGSSFRRTSCCQVTAPDQRHCGDCVRL